jgi:putative redox protein
MKVTAQRSARTALSHNIAIRQHHLVVDEPTERGGEDDGASPLELLAASLASCTAVTVEMYAQRKGWDIGLIEVDVDYVPAERGYPTKFKLALRLPADCTAEQRERLQVIATKCPVHRALEGEVIFEDCVELLEPSAA